MRTSLVAVLFVCGKSVLEETASQSLSVSEPSPVGEGGSRRLTDEEFLSDFAFIKIGSLKFKVFTILFRFRAEFTERSIFGAVGGIR